MKLNQKGYRLLFGMMWFIYFCSYLGRLNYTAVMGALIGTVIDKTQAGWVQTCFLIAYACGQLISGLVADRVSPRALVTVGAVGGGLVNIAFAFVHTFEQMALLRFVTGLCMSIMWPGMLCAMVKYMTEKDKLRASIDMATSLSIGTLFSYGANAVILKWMNWSWAFVLPGALLCFVGIGWYLLFPKMEALAVLTEELPQIVAAEKDGPAQLPLSRVLVVPFLLAAIIPTAFHGAIKDGVTAWIPAYLCEVHELSPAFSSFLSMLLPVFNLAGAYMAKYVYGKTGGNPLTGSSIFFALSLVLLGFMLVGAQTMLVPTLICFALITSFMMAINVMLINLLPLRFEKYGRASTVYGTLNALAYGGSALASGLIGVFSARFGWSATVASWFAMIAIALVISVVFRSARQTVKEPAEK